MKKSKILLLLWHSNDAVAGGFIRVKKILPYFKDLPLTIIDNNPALINDNHNNIELLTYSTPKFIETLYRFNFIIARFFEWSHSLYSLIRLGSRELEKGNYKIIYGPTGDNPHIFAAGIILKTLFPKKRLLLDVLNLEMPEDSTQQYYNSFRSNGYSIFESFIRAYGLSLLIFIQKVFIRRCDFVVTVSPHMKRIIERYMPKGKIDYTPSGVDLPQFSRKFKNFDAIFVGRHTKDKGIFDLINVWEKVSKEMPSAVLVTAGSIEDRTRETLEKQILEKGITSKIKIKGIVSEKEKWNLLSQSKYFLHLAYTEPLVPVITILEALASGLPVIMYDIRAIDDYPFLRNHPAIYIVKNKDIDGVIKTILHLEELPKEKIDKISVEARKLAEKFSWKEIAKKEVNVIRYLAL